MGNPKVNATILSKSTVTGDFTDVIIGMLDESENGAGKISTSVQNLTETELDALFGENTFIRDEVRRWLNANGKYSKLDVIAHSIPASAYPDNATSELVLSGTATEDGTLTLKVYDAETYTIDIAVSTDDTETDIGDAIDTAMALKTDLPVSSANVAGTVTFTALDSGTIGNNYPISFSGSVAGISYTLSGFSGGSGVPTTYLDLDPTKRYYGFMVNADVVAVTAEFTALMTDIEARLNESNAIKDGRAFITKVDSLSNVVTYVDEFNYKNLTVLSQKAYASEDDAFLDNELRAGCNLLTCLDLSAVETMAIRSRRMTADADISDFVIASGRDTVGGFALASFPFFNTPLAYTPVASKSLLFDDTDKLAINNAGGSVIGVNDSETEVVLDSLKTTYKYDTAGNTDTTFAYLNAIDTASAIREYIFKKMKIDFAQTRLTEGGLVKGRNIQNEGSIKAKVLQYCATLSGDDYVLVQEGSSIMTYIASTMNIVLNLSSRNVFVSFECPIVSQLGSITVPITIIYEPTGV